MASQEVPAGAGQSVQNVDATRLKYFKAVFGLLGPDGDRVAGSNSRSSVIGTTSTLEKALVNNSYLRPVRDCLLR
jgi:hypothetical protein